MLTSEQQKIYNVKVPKGGYGYYTLYHGIYDPENDIDERPVYAQTGDLFEPEGSSVVYKATRRNGKTTWAIDEDAQRQSESGEGGSGGGSGGGGAEKFIVTLTQDAQTEEWTADKTVAEIVAADAAGKDVVVSFQYMGQLPTELPKVSWIHDPEGTNSVFMFSGIIYGESEEAAFIVGQQSGGSDAWQVTFTPIPTSTNAPLIVTLTADGATGNLVGNKTYKEVYDAVNGGQTVTFKSAFSGFTVSTNALSVGLSSGGYSVAFVFGGSITEAEGAENDYVSVHIH